MGKSAYVGVYQLLNWKMHGKTLKRDTSSSRGISLLSFEVSQCTIPGILRKEKKKLINFAVRPVSREKLMIRISITQKTCYHTLLCITATEMTTVQEAWLLKTETFFLKFLFRDFVNEPKYFPFNKTIICTCCPLQNDFHLKINTAPYEPSRSWSVPWNRFVKVLQITPALVSTQRNSLKVSVAFFVALRTKLTQMFINILTGSRYGPVASYKLKMSFYLVAWFVF